MLVAFDTRGHQRALSTRQRALLIAFTASYERLQGERLFTRRSRRVDEDDDQQRLSLWAPQAA